MTTYYMLGCALSAAFPIIFLSYERKPKIETSIIFTCFVGCKLTRIITTFNLAMGSLIGTLHLGYVQLTTFLALCVGFFLFTLLHMSVNQTFKLIACQANVGRVRVYLVAVLLTVGGSASAVVTGVGDKVHYMNRDVTDWIYACQGFIAFLTAISYVLQMITTKFIT